MSDFGGPRIFISYSRQDGAHFAANLRNFLAKQGLSVWQDLVALEGGIDWWSQIEVSLRSKDLQHFILVVTPSAITSAVVRREIRLAKQEGKSVLPVRGPGIADLDQMPRWMGQIDDLELPERLAQFLTVLKGPSKQRRVPMMAPELPEGFVKRPVEFGVLKARLLDCKGDAIAITAALKGAGGYGKTTLARAIAHDEEVQDAYVDGILWIELGQEPGNLLASIADLIEVLTGARPGVVTINAAAAKLAEVMGGRRFLLIIDDVWRAQDLSPFLQGGQNTSRLVTTRNSAVLPTNAFRQPVDEMAQQEADSLLTYALPLDQVEILRTEFRLLSSRLGNWAQLIKLVNGFLRDRVDTNERLRDAIGAANYRLDEAGLIAFDAESENDRFSAVTRTVNLSLSLLNAQGRELFSSLSIFQEDIDIPIGLICEMWYHKIGLSNAKSYDILINLNKLSLIQNLDGEAKTIRLHDTIRDFLRSSQNVDEVRCLHQDLIDTLDRSVSNNAASRLYRHKFLLWHLASARQHSRLSALLASPAWLQMKLEVTNSPQMLAADYDQFGSSSLHDLLGRTLRLITGILSRDKRQLMPQLIGRLMSFSDQEVSEFVTNARQLVQKPAILTGRPSLISAGAETNRFGGHDDRVNALVAVPFSRLASASDDKAIRIWDLAREVESARLEGHTAPVSALVMASSNLLASGSEDHTIRLWDAASGLECNRLEGHSGAVTALIALPNGQLASGSLDGTIRIWDIASGNDAAALHGNGEPIVSLALVSTGRLAAGGIYGTIRLWDFDEVREVGLLTGHRMAVTALVLLGNGRLASRSWDNTIRLWDTKTWQETDCLDHAGTWGGPLKALPDGRLAADSEDGALCILDPAGGPTIRLKASFSGFDGLEILDDGRVATCHFDPIKLWDIKSAADEDFELEPEEIRGLTALPGGLLASSCWGNTIWVREIKNGTISRRIVVPGPVTGPLALLRDGRPVYCSMDEIRIWDLEMNTEMLSLKQHGDFVQIVAPLHDGNLASGSGQTIRIWDVKHGTEIMRLQGHTGRWILALAVLPNGVLASSSRDNTIRVWDLANGADISCISIDHHAYSLAALPSGRLAAGGNPGKIQIWDVAASTIVGQLHGHRDWIAALAALPDGRLISSSGDLTIRLWDIGQCEEVACLEIDAVADFICILSDNALVVGDRLGRLHWLDIIK